MMENDQRLPALMFKEETSDDDEDDDAETTLGSPVRTLSPTHPATSEPEPTASIPDDEAGAMMTAIAPTPALLAPSSRIQPTDSAQETQGAEEEMRSEMHTESDAEAADDEDVTSITEVFADRILHRNLMEMANFVDSMFGVYGKEDIGMDDTVGGGDLHVS
ncbi:hypothetical protein ATCC90586_002276 [Pythium insidiosum]|nr:hypothetical protein ATCC90586_002276 [Pythium insidiosum]